MHSLRHVLACGEVAMRKDIAPIAILLAVQYYGTRLCHWVTSAAGENALDAGLKRLTVIFFAWRVG
jgi:hypothetical protein